MRIDTHEEKSVAVHMTEDELHKILIKALENRHGVELPRAEGFHSLSLERHDKGYTLRGVLPASHAAVEKVVC